MTAKTSPDALLDVPPNFVNRTIFTGDNLPVMRGLNSAAVDLVYLDPPFNSKKPWAAPIGSKAAGAAFKDTWTLNDIDVLDHEQLRTTHPRLHDVVLAGAAARGDSTLSYLLYMAPRLLELRRVLKPAGSLFLHCDPTESHSLKLMLDVIFGPNNFRNEIVWKRTAGRSDGGQFGRVHDVIFYYGPDGRTWHRPYVPLDPDYVAKAYTNVDERGRWRGSTLFAAGTSGGQSGRAWRGVDPTATGQHWRTPTKGGMNSFLQDYIPGWPAAYPTVHERLDVLDEYGFVHWPTGGKGIPRLKRYLASSNGTAVPDIFTDIGKLEAASKEKVGYPTQKPVALLRRLIAAASNEGDVVLDPFAGCATAAVAAEDLGRQWVGIDLSEKAAELVEYRLREHLGLFYDVAHRTDIPRRTDLGKLPPPSHWKETLYGEQGGDCNGCGTHFLPDNLTTDHIVPKSKGGTDHRTNLQLLCGRCNSRKGNRSMSVLMTKLLADRGIRPMKERKKQGGGGFPPANT